MKTYLKVILLITLFLSQSFHSIAQFKYQAGKLLINTNTAQSYYTISVSGNGTYFTHTNGRFFQLDLTPTGAPRLAGHNDEIVFFNSSTSHFNDIQVGNVYNYSDSRAKTDIRNMNQGLEIIKRLRPVSYNFVGKKYKNTTRNIYTNTNAEIGLLAQELEEVLPNVVFTDEDGKKLINYIALIPVLIDAVKTLQKEIDDLNTLKE